MKSLRSPQDIETLPFLEAHPVRSVREQGGRDRLASSGHVEDPTLS